METDKTRGEDSRYRWVKLYLMFLHECFSTIPINLYAGSIKGGIIFSSSEPLAHGEQL